MKKDNIKNYKRGWILGVFDPVIFNIVDNYETYEKAPEIGVQFYHAGDSHDYHYHKLVTEWNVIAKGKCVFRTPNEDIELVEGDILVIEPNEPAQLFAISDCCVVCLKNDSVSGDKYIYQPSNLKEKS